MKLQTLVAEIGSTTTLVSAFAGLAGRGKPEFLGQGIAPTTVEAGDVNIGLQNALSDLGTKLGARGPLEWDEMMASSSAAGGLRMTVHGLVYEMTVRAAREAALGAGAVIKLVTAGMLTGDELDQVADIAPNIILLAGGVDYGEKTTIVENARRLAEVDFGKAKPPIIFAGNITARREVEKILRQKGLTVVPVENVYPRIDELNVDPAKRVIQRVFEEHIVKAPGMNQIRRLVNGSIIPTPGAVMKAAELVYRQLGDLMVLDVGGATTDVHSVTEGSEEVACRLLAPEPLSKRTVEGDLGVYVNAGNVVDLIGPVRLQEELGFDFRPYLRKREVLPRTEKEVAVITRLTREACFRAVERHVGRWKYVFGPTGRNTVAEGKDLTRVRWVIGTGGALTRLPAGPEILKSLVERQPGDRLWPPRDAGILVDRDYILASVGVLSGKYPEAALRLACKSLEG